MKTYLPATLICDFYKVCHKNLYPQGTESIYSTFTPRSNKYFPLADKVVAFGFQGFVKKYLIEYFNEHFFNRPKQEVLDEFDRVIRYTLGEQYVDSTHIAELHDLGYLPVRISTVEEGTLVPMKVPLLTIENTDSNFHWLTNYLETMLSTQIWQTMTSATIARQYKKLLSEYAIKTTGTDKGVEFNGHDFSMRGMSSLESAQLSGAGHLLSFVGSDTIPAITYLEQYYNANVEKELVATSIVATEHSIMSANTPADGNRDEYAAFKRLITEVYPNGFISLVSDTYDLWDNVDRVLPLLKEEIMNRDGKVVIRPDSGVPEDILCGTLNTPVFDDYIQAKERLNSDTVYYDNSLNKHMKYDYETKSITEYEVTLQEKGLIESLWNTFGGTITEQGYKVLDSHIGAIYGDSITIERATEISERLAQKGFASTNVVYGIGSYTYQMNSRDSFGFAMKATHATINGEDVMLFKDPKTDDGTKRSNRGRVHVYEFNGELYAKDGLTIEQESEANLNSPNLLEPLFENGKLLREISLGEIREKLKVLD